MNFASESMESKLSIPMSLEVQLLWLPRAGSNTLEYEAVCVHERETTLPFRLALADPDKNTIRPDLWADLLARGFVDEGALNSSNVTTDLLLRQAAYAACIATEPLGDIVAEPARTGFAGLTIEAGNRWRLVCSPGYCIVQIHDSHSDMMTTACQPTVGPLADRKMISSYEPQSVRFSHYEGRWQEGDRLLLCNPTAAPWLGRENETEMLGRVARSSLAAFQGLAKRTRLDGRLEGGDVAVAVIQL